MMDMVDSPFFLGNTQMVNLEIVLEGIVYGRWINGPSGNSIEHVIEP